MSDSKLKRIVFDSDAAELNELLDSTAYQALTGH